MMTITTIPSEILDQLLARYTGPENRMGGSRTLRGKGSIKGGRAHFRQAFYIPAFAAMRFNPNLKNKYNAMTKTGKPAKVAITAFMRKLVLVANILLRDNRKWVPKNL
ncbi:transposase [Beijerinckia mobilis]|uniref:transposase n=1 Tax=Beijerinckia mobilis TaxID=231434 RepID=UPI0005596192|nr:transposase [Beijerinckia mobilis]